MSKTLADIIRERKEAKQQEELSKDKLLITVTDGTVIISKPTDESTSN
ncbi:hypothetical protein [Priestia abyssalis]|nr:hypothetical protein [Priestia abyssalis]